MAQALVHLGQDLVLELRVRHPSRELTLEQRRDKIYFTLYESPATIDMQAFQRNEHEAQDSGEQRAFATADSYRERWTGIFDDPDSSVRPEHGCAA